MKKPWVIVALLLFSIIAEGCTPQVFPAPDPATAQENDHAAALPKPATRSVQRAMWIKKRSGFQSADAELLIDMFDDYDMSEDAPTHWLMTLDGSGKITAYDIYPLSSRGGGRPTLDAVTLQKCVN